MSTKIAKPAAKSAATPRTRSTEEKKEVVRLQRVIVDALEDVKAIDIAVFDTEHLSSLFERVTVASGASNRQTRALAVSVSKAVREAGFGKPRMEGEDNGEWIIVDCGAAVVHVMQPAIRQYYHLEEIWGDKPVKLKLGAPAPEARAVKKHVVTDNAAGAARQAKPEKAPISKDKQAFTQAPKPVRALSGAKVVATLAKKSASKAVPAGASAKKAPVSKNTAAAKPATAKKPASAKLGANPVVVAKKASVKTASSKKPVIVTSLVGKKAASRRPAPKTPASGKGAPRKAAVRKSA